jgi:hypothetical protein
VPLNAAHAIAECRVLAIQARGRRTQSELSRLNFFLATSFSVMPCAASSVRPAPVSGERGTAGFAGV